MNILNYKNLNDYAFKNAMSVGICILMAIVIDYYFSFSKEYWIILSAFLVNQTTRGTALRQGLIIFMTIFTAIEVASLLSLYVRADIIYYILYALFILSGYMAFINRPQSGRSYFFESSFFILLLLALLTPVKTAEFMRYRVFDISIGALIGILGSAMVLPVKLDKEFSAGVIPILDSLREYTNALAACFVSFEQTHGMGEYKQKVEMTLQSQQGMYPEWVYEVGFNRGLRSGFRFFLVNLEHIIELYFSMNYLLARHVDPLGEVNDHIVQSLKKNDELLEILIHYFQNNKLLEIQSDFTSDTIELEKSLNQVVPNNLELLAITPNNLLLTALVRDMRDLRGLLLQLVKALPTKQLAQYKSSSIRE